jgi:hypothetical protein
MGHSATLSRRERKELARRKARQRKIIPIIIVAFGILIVGVSLITYFSNQTAVDEDVLAYAPEDVARDRPISAIHEMGEGPPIPFLPRDESQPAVLLPEKTYDFGMIGPQDVVNRTFIIRNTGEAPLTISRAYTTCGCTTAEISASVIPPGMVAEATLIFDAGFHDTAGQSVRRGLIIENNDPNQSKAEYWTTAKVSN